jgi:transcriptional regulator with XRE-family HTH domain
VGVELVLRRERQRRGWSLLIVSAKTGITSGDLSLIERGKREAFPGWRRRIATAFGQPESVLFAPAGSPEASAVCERWK